MHDTFDMLSSAKVHVTHLKKTPVQTEVASLERLLRPVAASSWVCRRTGRSDHSQDVSLLPSSHGIGIWYSHV